MLETILGIPRAGGWVNKDPSDDYWYMPRGAETTSGQDIDEDSALAITTVFACVSKISKTIAALPVDVVEKVNERERRPAEHPLEELLDGQANDDASGMTLREALSANLELWGGAYVYVNWAGSRKNIPGRLQILESRYMSVKRERDNGDLYYEYRDPKGGVVVLGADDIWYIPGLSLNGMTGLSVVGYNRETLGLAAVATQFGAAFFGNGAWAGGFFTRPLEAPPLNEEAAQRFLDSVNEKFRGAKKAFGFGLLRESMDFKQIDMPFEDAMFLATRQFQRVEICGMFDMPPVMIQDYERSTYNNTEQADLAFAKHSIVPRCVRIERSARKRFFPNSKLYLKHNLAALVRGDFKTRMEGYALGRQWGMYSINDIRAMDDLNSIPGGDTYLEPLNMIPIGQPRPMPAGVAAIQELDTIVVPHSYPAAAVPEPEKDSEHEPQPNAVSLDFVLPFVRHSAERISTRQCKAAIAAWKKHARDGREETFAQWADKFFVQHAEIVKAELEPILSAWEVASGEKPHITADELAGRLCRGWQATVLAQESGLESIPNLVNQWKQNLADEIITTICDVFETERNTDDVQGE